jgi:hypothetical protein
LRPQATLNTTEKEPNENLNAIWNDLCSKII